MYLKLFNNNMNEINELYFKTLINLGCEVPKIVFDTFDVKDRIVYYIKQNEFDMLLFSYLLCSLCSPCGQTCLSELTPSWRYLTTEVFSIPCSTRRFT